MGLTLYEIDQRIRDTIEEHTDEHGVLSEEGDRALDELFGKREDKLLAYGCVIKELRREAEAVKAEAKAMRDRAHSIERRAEHLRDQVAEALGPDGKLKDHRCSFYWNRSTATMVDKPDELPYELRRITTSPDLPKVKEHLEAENYDGDLDGIARLEERRTLVVR